jgi:hypothetical protein
MRTTWYRKTKNQARPIPTCPPWAAHLAFIEAVPGRCAGPWVRAAAARPLPDGSAQELAHPKRNPDPRSQAEDHHRPTEDGGTPVDRVHDPAAPPLQPPNAILLLPGFEAATKVSFSFSHRLIPVFHRGLVGREAIAPPNLWTFLWISPVSEGRIGRDCSVITGLPKI